MSQSSIDLNIGDKKQLDCKFKYNNSYTQAITYSSSDNRVAAVNVGGLVTANAEGTATITAKSASSRYEVSCVVTVTAPVNGPTAITISPTSKTINVGKTFYASYTLTPSNATTTVTWPSDDSSIASVDSKTGLVTGKKAGYTYINATTTNGKTDWCKVTVENDAKLSLSANPSSGSVESGSKVYLTASANGSSVSGVSIYYTLNGNKPSTSSNKYTSSGITINESCTLKAFATKSGYNDSDVTTWNFTVSTNDIIEINDTNFPDKAFRDWILEQDYGKDGKLTKAEISEVKIIIVLGTSNIASLKGIEYFTSLAMLFCDDNQLTSLDVSKNTELTGLCCSYNQLTALNVSKNTALTALDCSNNLLTVLDVSKNTALTELYCYNNQIRGRAMDNLISSLHNNSSDKEYKFYVFAPTDRNEGNVCTKAQVAAAKAKGWTPYYYNSTEWLEYEGSDASDVKAIKKDSEADAPIYNLRGQRLAAPQKGINIIDGKKVVVK